MIDFQILDWTMGAPVDESILEKYFGAIPDFVDSNLVKISGSDFTLAYYNRFWEVFCGFLGRTLSVDPVNEALKACWLVKCMNVMDVVPCPCNVSDLIYCIIDERLGHAPLSVETGHTLARHFSNNNDRYSSQYAQYCVARILMTVKNRDDCWFALSRGQLGLSEPVLRNLLAHGDSVMLAVFLHVTRQVIRTKSSNWDILSTLPQFDIRDTLPELQHEFCALWNEIVLEAKTGPIDHEVGPSLHGLRRSYIALHEDTDAAPTAFSIATVDVDPILRQPQSYPSCNINDHHQNLSPDLVTTALEPIPITITPLQVEVEPTSLPEQPSVPLTRFPYPSAFYPTSHTFPSTSLPISKEADIVPVLSPSSDTPPRSQRSLSSPPISVPAQIPPEVTSVMATSIPENTETIS